MSIDPIQYAKNRAYQVLAEQQHALDEGRISEAEWFEIHNRFFTEHYLAADDPRGQSGHSGGEAQYRDKRMMILEAIHKDGTFLDVGCANGYLMESLDRWLQGSGLTVEFYGLDISEPLLALAKRRSPQWADRFLLGNALYWTPPQQYDFVYLIGPELVPMGRQAALIDRLMQEFVRPGGRLILGPVNEERSVRTLEDQLRAWGHKPSGYCEKSHQTYEQIARKMFWFDRA
jgi:2-polyprenyl-3-methyl-5-hydroxy-6-metoxy-1,4-benzoquinol methylase